MFVNVGSFGDEFRCPKSVLRVEIFTFYILEFPSLARGAPYVLFPAVAAAPGQN